MKQSNNNIRPEEILKYLDTPDLHKFIIDYGAVHPDFKTEFITHFSPQQVSADKEDYAGTVINAFGSNALKSANRYHDYGDFGFDALDVAGDLKPLLDKADYFINHKNSDEAILICCALIETIPDEWNPDFDYDGDVQVIYDAAIDKLQEMLKQNLLSIEQKKTLFSWYSAEHKNDKHEYVGLNTWLKALEEFFVDTPEMLQQNMKNIDERMESANNDYSRERAAMDKVRLLQNAGLKDEAETMISQYLTFSDIRKLRVEKFLHEKNYEQAIDLIKDGIKIEASNGHPGTVADWKDNLLDIYRLQKDTSNILLTAEDLFITGREGKKYYFILKQYTPQSEWPATLHRLLAAMRDDGYSGVNDLKAEILVEHKMWDRLFALCKKANVESLEQYEKHLKPHYAKEIFDAYYNYVEKQSLIANKQAYINVARVLKKMKRYEGGNKVVDRLLLRYRELYKRRKNMMEELRGG